MPHCLNIKFIEIGILVKILNSNQKMRRPVSFTGVLIIFNTDSLVCGFQTIKANSKIILACEIYS